MSWVWVVLGALLITVVAAVCVVFFIVRPIVARRVNSAMELLGRELHGRQPLRYSAVRCEACTRAAGPDLRGLGALALTDQAFVFAVGEAASLIVPLAWITSLSAQTTFAAGGRAVRHRLPMLVLRWRTDAGAESAVAFTVDDPDAWIAAASPGLTADASDSA